MRVVRITDPGNTLARWVPAWENDGASPQLTVECMAFPGIRQSEWLDHVRRYVERHPDTLIQYEGKSTWWLTGLGNRHAVIHVLQHLTAVPKKTTFPYTVVPSYYARERLRKKGYRAFTIFPAVEGKTLPQPNGARRRTLTLLLYQGATTKRLLRAVSSLSQKDLDVEWVLIGDKSERVKKVMRFLPQNKQPIRIRTVEAGDLSAWQGGDVLVTDQHPVYSLNALHLRAMANGIPVMTTDVGDHPEVVKHWHNGFLLELPRLQDDLSHYVQHILRQPALLGQLRINGRSLCETFHAKGHILPKWQRLYELVGRHT